MNLPNALFRTLLLTAWVIQGHAVAAETTPATAPETATAPTVVVTPTEATPPGADEPFATDEWRHANETAPAEEKASRKRAQVGRQTRQWVQAQGNQEQASRQRPTLSGPVLRKTHERYLRSFDNEIPQQLRESLPDNK